PTVTPIATPACAFSGVANARTIANPNTANKVFFNICHLRSLEVRTRGVGKSRGGEPSQNCGVTACDAGEFLRDNDQPSALRITLPGGFNVAEPNPLGVDLKLTAGGVCEDLLQGFCEKGCRRDSRGAENGQRNAGTRPREGKSQPRHFRRLAAAGSRVG